MTYDGWSNRDTWAFNLWISNSEGDYNYWREEAENAGGAANLADSMNIWYDELFEMVLSGELTNDEAINMVRDIGNGFHVDWFEVAESWLEDLES